MMKKFFAALLHPLVLSVLGILALAMVIWFVGPLIAIAGYEPLASPNVRWLLIGLLVLALVLRWLIRLWRARANNARLLDGIVGTRTEQAVVEPAELATLRQRFEEALKVLRQNQAGPDTRGLGRLAALGTRRYLYQLPWYVFIGAPGSGKTTALVNSGLRFPLAEKFGSHELKGIGGTRNCDWWFTDEAVLIDTAGRYTTQDSDQPVDREAWQGFLALLRKHRPRQPLNGVLLTISLGDLLAQSEAEATRHADALRNRVQELYTQLGVRIPVYVVLTKSDRIAGFDEFFANLGKEGRAQVWGVTFPLEQSAEQALQALPGSLAALLERLDGQLLTRLQEEADLGRRGLIAAFDQQFAAASRLLEGFLGKVLAPSGFDHPLLVRGVYFTSGTQQGNPIDRVLASLGGAFGLEQRVLPPPAGSGKSFFLSRLLREVVFAEQRVGGTNLKWERRRGLIHTGGLIVLALLTLGLLLGWTLSYLTNSRYLDEVDTATEAAKPLVAQSAGTAQSDVLGVLSVLESVQGVSASATRQRGEAPLSMGFGLFQGDKIDSAAGQAYRGLLREVLFPRLVNRVENQLRSLDGSNLEYAYETLKAYLMLHDARHFDSEALKAWITLDWERNLPREVTADQRVALSTHLNRLFADGPVASPVVQDAALVSRTREMLLRYPLANRIYSRLKRQGVGDAFPDFTIPDAGGPSSTLVFARKSGAPLTRGIPGLYTYDGYHQGFNRQVAAATRKLAEEDPWVLGASPGSGAAREVGSVANDVRRLYLADYVKAWEALLADLTIVRSGSLSQSIETAGILSGPDSPLPRLFKAIARQTTLTPPATEKSLADKAEEKLDSAKQELRKVFGAAGQTAPALLGGPPLRLESIVDERFAEVRRLAGGGDAPAGMDAVMQSLKDVHAQLLATDQAIKSKVAPPPGGAAGSAKRDSAQHPEPIRSMLQQLSNVGSNQIVVATRDSLNSAVGAQVAQFCNLAIDGRYPFARSSKRDVTRDDFARLLGPGGLMDDFFQKNLAQYVDTSTRQWTFKKVQEQSLGGSGNLAQFQRAATIRDVFFSKSGPMQLIIRPLEMDPTISQFTLDVDGQLVKYAHGPQVPQSVQWPGSKGGLSARVQIAPPGPTGVSGHDESGPWAIYRLFDRARIEGLGDPVKFKVTFDVDGRQASFEVSANSVQNPFRLRELAEFRCPSGL
ncbi:MAG: type VI secretion system membrane subunit TssM [Candidatus Accumulibacter sp.]|uniref:type VI secretion system membrane subunit TssM n=1 Tax=Accumulibacter sp. TaxID=2053492 RepID=UPI00287A10CB|nr:type VI secretion system membrane subunit TssM [Accumulibacter sp.]MDS4015083.1 type VI secretion system membrane subunit TssM [Accumulibacter sp.]